MIRRSTEEDRDGVIAVWLETSLVAHCFVPATYWQMHVGEMRDVYLPKSETFVFIDEESGRIVGFISVVDHYIAALFVLPSFQGRGIGCKLIDAVLGLNDYWELKVYSENRASVRFYKNRGFKSVEERLDGMTGHRELKMVYWTKER